MLVFEYLKENFETCKEKRSVFHYQNLLMEKYADFKNNVSNHIDFSTVDFVTIVLFVYLFYIVIRRRSYSTRWIQKTSRKRRRKIEGLYYYQSSTRRFITS